MQDNQTTPQPDVRYCNPPPRDPAVVKAAYAAMDAMQLRYERKLQRKQRIARLLRLFGIRKKV